MTKNQFINIIRQCDSDIFKEIAIEKDNMLIPVKRICNSKNDSVISFINTEKKVITSINKRDMSTVKQLNTSLDNSDYSLLITTKNDKSIRVHINMKDGYSLYAYTDDVIRNYKAVAEDVPNHLDKFKGETVVVKHSTNSAMYRTFSEEENGYVLPVTDSYIMHNFDYVIFYDGSLSCGICRQNIHGFKAINRIRLPSLVSGLIKSDLCNHSRQRKHLSDKPCKIPPENHLA